MIAPLSFNPRKMSIPLVVMLAFWTLSVAMWQASDNIIPLFMFGYIGASVGLGLGLYSVLPK